MHKFISWIITIGGAISQLAYVFFTGSTNSNLSISGEAYFNRNRGRLRYVWYRFINMLFFMQKDHCKWAYDNDLKFAQWYIDRDRNSRL
ncbi:MAG: hypothetical protein II242_07680 [Peptococcaceae bacterium]|nr:hypothetical protein [Peptococcaceae bacterium]